MSTKKRGFTLIELLVVISIIGLLSSVVLASLSTTRTRGRAAAIRSALTSLRTQMELEANPPGRYGMTTNYTTGVGDNASCGFNNFATTKVAQIRTNMASNLAVSTDYVCSVNVSSLTVPATRWAVAAILPGGAGLACVDSTGESKVYSGVTTVAGISTATHLNNGDCI